MLRQETVVVKLKEDILRNLSLKLGGCAAEDIKADVEPFVNFSMEGIVFVAKFLGGHVLLDGSRFGRRAVLIGT